VFWVIGWSIAATLGAGFETMLGWRGILAVGASPIVLALVSALVLPESPRFLMARGHVERAHALAAQLAARHGVHVPLGRAPVTRARTSIVHQLGTIWSAALWRRTFALWTTWGAMNAIFSGPIYMLPLVLESLGAAQPLQLSAYVGYAMIPASLISVYAIDRSGRRPLMIASLGLAGIGALIVAFGPTPQLVVIGGCLLSGGTLAAWPVALAWASELYPTSIRGAAAGWAAGVSRLGSIAAPLILGNLLVLGGGHTAAMLPFACALFASVASVAIFASETANQTLEELTQASRPAES
jgi:putative MFS transporter